MPSAEASLWPARAEKGGGPQAARVHEPWPEEAPCDVIRANGYNAHVRRQEGSLQRAAVSGETLFASSNVSLLSNLSHVYRMVQPEEIENLRCSRKDTFTETLIEPHEVQWLNVHSTDTSTHPHPHGHTRLPSAEQPRRGDRDRPLGPAAWGAVL